MNWKLSLLVVVTALAPATASANFLSGNELFNYMTSSDPVYQTASKLYIAGVADSAAWRNKCTFRPNIKELYDLVLVNVASRPAQRHLPANVFVETVLQERLGCGK